MLIGRTWKSSPKLAPEGVYARCAVSYARLLFLLFLAACPKRSAPQEPAPPPVPDASPDIDAPEPEPMQTPQASTAILAASYAQHCTRDDECVAVFEGNACNPCRCAFNAIRVDAFAKYKADLGAYWACHKPDECAADCRQAIGDVAKCENGTCILPP